MRALGGLAAAVLWPSAVRAASASCANASTVVQDSDTVAIAYDASCTARTFTVLQQSATQLSLNLSNLDIATVESYPRVYEMDLSHNKLTNFSIAADNDMETLYVGAAAQEYRSGSIDGCVCTTAQVSGLQHHCGPPDARASLATVLLVSGELLETLDGA